MLTSASTCQEGSWNAQENCEIWVQSKMSAQQETSHLKDHAYVAAMSTSVLKPVVKPHTVLLVLRVAILYLCQQRDLIPCSLCVVLRTLLNLW